MRKGKLHKLNINNIWIVECSEYDYEGLPIVGQQFTIYPGPLPLPEGMGIDDYLYEGHEIDFVLISEEGMRWAKPIIPREPYFIHKMLESMTAEEFDKRCTLFFNHEKMIEFAKFHVEAALKAVAEKAKVNVVPTDEEPWEIIPEVITFEDLEYNEGIMLEVDKDSILNAYSLTNIK